MQDYLKKITKTKKGGVCGSSGRMPAQQVQDPDFRTPIPPKKGY
jgi:hypothetical protein